MKNLQLLSSLFFLCLFMSSCTTVYNLRFKDCNKKNIQKEEIPQLVNEVETSLYKGSFDVYGRYLSGLLYLKPTQEQSYRVVFLTEVGMKMFDVEVFKDDFKVHYALKYLDKKILWNLLEKDLRLLLTENLIGEKICFCNYQEQKMLRHRKKRTYYFFNEDNTLKKIEKRSRFRSKMFVYLENHQNQYPTEIKVEHKGIDLNIKLRKIER